MTDLEKLAARIETLSPADQLRLAAGLLDEARTAPEAGAFQLLGMAHAIVSRISTELGALDALRGPQ